MKSMKIAALAMLWSIGCSDSASFKGGNKTNTGGSEVRTVDNPNPVPADFTTMTDDTLGSQETDRKIIFAKETYLRLGNNLYAPSSACAQEMQQNYPKIHGHEYRFEFTVEEDNTVIDILIRSVCGTDAGSGSSASLLNNEKTELDNSSHRFEKHHISSSVELKRTVLDSGTYFFRLQSGKGESYFGEFDYDDFVVKGIEIKANKAITVGKVNADRQN